MEISELKESYADGVLRISSTISEGGGEIACVVLLPQYFISLKGVNDPPRPVPAKGAAQPDNTVLAYRVQNITAEPKKLGLGAYLVWHAAKKASAAGAQYMLAMKVNPKTHNWYKRMGFEEYDSGKSIEFLLQHEATIRGQLDEMGENPAFVEMLSPALESVMASKSDMIRFAKASTVIETASAAWKSRWESSGNGWKQKEN